MRLLHAHALLRGLRFAALLTALGAVAQGASSAALDRPSIVLIYTDDIGFGDIGCYGATKVRTPHIDRLAREGRTFTDAHSASAVCTPSRYAVLTGEYPLRINSWAPVFARSALLIDPQTTTLASLLKRRGALRTAARTAPDL